MRWSQLDRFASRREDSCGASKLTFIHNLRASPFAVESHFAIDSICLLSAIDATFKGEI